MENRVFTQLSSDSENEAYENGHTNMAVINNYPKNDSELDQKFIIWNQYGLDYNQYLNI